MPTTTKRRNARVTAHPGRVLKSARLSKKLRPLQVARQLNISKQQLEALELWQTEKLPKGVYLQGLVDKYASALDVDTAKLHADFPEVFDLPESAHAKPSSRKPKKPKRNFVLTRTLKLAILFAIVSTALGYVIWQTSSLRTPPRLDIHEPSEGATVSQQSVHLSGTTSTGAQVYVNGSPVLVDTDGNFATDVVLSPGTNVVEIKAVNTLSREALLTRTIVYQPNSPLDEQR